MAHTDSHHPSNHAGELHGTTPPVVPPPDQERHPPQVVIEEHQRPPVRETVPRDSQPRVPGHPPEEQHPPDLIIYSHSTLFYWWPVWLGGFIMALVTYLEREPLEIGTEQVWFHPSSNLGVIYFLTVFLVMVITNAHARGLVSALVIMGAILVTVVFAYFGLWDAILGWFDGLKIHLNLGAYFWFSALVFIAWLLAFFVFDRMTYWRIKPGQVTHEFVFGAGSKTYDTENLVLEKHRDDLFRHWILGLGAGDLHIKPYGADREAIEVPNVLFVGTKIETIHKMIATQPEHFKHTARV